MQDTWCRAKTNVEKGLSSWWFLCQEQVVLHLKKGVRDLVQQTEAGNKTFSLRTHPDARCTVNRNRYGKKPGLLCFVRQKMKVDKHGSSNTQKSAGQEQRQAQSLTTE